MLPNNIFELIYDLYFEYQSVKKNLIHKNRYVFTWILHQVLMYSAKMMLVAGQNNDTTLPSLPQSPPLFLDEQTNQ